MFAVEFEWRLLLEMFELGSRIVHTVFGCITVKINSSIPHDVFVHGSLPGFQDMFFAVVHAVQDGRIVLHHVDELAVTVCSSKETEVLKWVWDLFNVFNLKWLTFWTLPSILISKLDDTFLVIIQAIHANWIFHDFKGNRTYGDSISFW